MKFLIKDFSTFTGEILNGKLHFFMQWILLHFWALSKKMKLWGYLYKKSLWWIPILVETYNVPKAKLVDGRSVSGYW